MKPLLTVGRASLVLLSLTGLCFAGAGRVGVAAGGDPPSPVFINSLGQFTITPDKNGGGIFELINDTGGTITSFQLNLTLESTGTAEGGTGSEFKPTDGALAGLNTTAFFGKPGTNITDTFESFLFTSVQFEGDLIGACGGSFAPITDSCLSVEFTGGATIAPGGFFIIDLNNSQATDYCQNPNGCTDPKLGHVPYGGLLSTQNDTGTGGFGKVGLTNGQVTTTPEPAALRFLLGGGLALGWWWRRRRA